MENQDQRKETEQNLQTEQQQIQPTQEKKEEKVEKQQKDKEEDKHSCDSDEEIKEDIVKKIKDVKEIKQKLKLIALNSYYVQKLKLDKELEKEIEEIKKKHQQKCEPLLQKQCEIINGDRAPTNEEVNDQKLLTLQEQGQLNENLEKSPIQDFWLTAMKNNQILIQEIKKKDEAALKHLTKIDVKYFQNNLDFELIFHFSDNDFFSNTELKKVMHFINEEEPKEGKGTEIQWKESKNLTVKLVKKQQKNKKTGQKRQITKEVEDESFFNFFKDTKNPELEGGEGKEEDDEENEEKMKQQDEILRDYDISRTIVDQLIPYSLEYYFGVAQNEDEYGDQEGDDDDQDNENDENNDDDQQVKKQVKATEDDEEPSEEIHQTKKNKKKNKKKNSEDNQDNKTSNKPAAGEAKPECKQQ